MTGADWLEQLRRLDRFRALHPAVVIGRAGGFGFWQAWIPEGNGGTVVTRYALQDLLDKLDDRRAPEPAAEDPRPDRPHAPGTFRATPDLGRIA